MTPYMATLLWINIGPEDGQLPCGTKPLPEPMLTYVVTQVFPFLG